MTEITIENLYGLQLYRDDADGVVEEKYFTPEGDVVTKTSTYFPNGKICTVTYMKNGDLHDVFGPAEVFYDSDGKVVEINSYREGQLHRDPYRGPASVFSHYDNCITCDYCVDDVSHRPREEGWATTHYENGQVTQKEAYEHGKRVNRKGYTRKVYSRGRVIQRFVVDEETQNIVAMEVYCPVGECGWWMTIKNPKGFCTETDEWYEYLVGANNFSFSSPKVVTKVKEKVDEEPDPAVEEPTPKVVEKVDAKVEEPTPKVVEKVEEPASKASKPPTFPPAEKMRKIADLAGRVAEDFDRRYRDNHLLTEDRLASIIEKLSNEGLTTFQFKIKKRRMPVEELKNAGYTCIGRQKGQVFDVFTVSW